MPAYTVDQAAPGVVHITLTEPERRNPIGPAVAAEMESRFDGGEAGAVVLSATGPVFSAGGDLALGVDGLAALSDRLYDLYERILVAPTVLVVAADGLAMGAGAMFVLCADIRVAGPRFGWRAAVPERAMAGGMWLLPGQVGRGRALDAFLTGRTLDAEEAHQWGIVDHVADDPVAEALRLAEAAAAAPAEFRARVKGVVAAAARTREAWATEKAGFRPPGRP